MINIYSFYLAAILCALLLGQCVILSVLARHFYCLPTPLMISADKSNSPIELTLLDSNVAKDKVAIPRDERLVNELKSNKINKSSRFDNV